MLLAADLDSPHFALRQADIVEYRPTDHAFVLTEDATTRFERAFGGGLGSSVNLEMTAFLVTLDGRRLFGGVFSYPTSARAIRYPVIYISEDGDHLVLTVDASRVGARITPLPKEQNASEVLRGFFESRR